MVKDRTAAVGMTPSCGVSRAASIGRLVFCAAFGLVLLLLTASPVKASSKPAQVLDILTEAGFFSDDGNGDSLGRTSARGLRMKEVDKRSALISIVDAPETAYADDSPVKQCTTRLDSIYFTSIGMVEIVKQIVTQGKAVVLEAAGEQTQLKNILYKSRLGLAFAYCLSLEDSARATIGGVLGSATAAAAYEALGTALWTWLADTTEGKKINGLLAQTDTNAGVKYLEQWIAILRRQTVSKARNTVQRQMADGMTNKILVPFNETIAKVAETKQTELGTLLTAYQGTNEAAKTAALKPLLTLFETNVFDVAAPFYNAYVGYRLEVPDSATGYTNKVYKVTYEEGAVLSAATISAGNNPAGMYGVYTTLGAFIPTTASTANDIFDDIKEVQNGFLPENNNAGAVAELNAAALAELTDLSVVFRGTTATDVAELLKEGKKPTAAAFGKMLYNKYAVTLPAVALVFATYVAL